jgi:tripartite-type tricarboxylate transporter receptor subunit TctC
MKLPRRKFLHLAAGAAALPAVSRIARAQAYPSRPVRIIVGFPAGSTSDIVARLIGQRLSERLGQSFVVENKAGASGNLATAAAAHAPADGYTLLLVGSNHAINATLFENLSFDFRHDLLPVAGIMSTPGVMVVNPSVPAKTVAEFIAFTKANPGKISMASAGQGSLLHMYGALFVLLAGINIVDVPYRGSPPALTDLMGGRVQVLFDNVPTSLEHIRSGKLRALAVTTRSKLDILPDIPPMAAYLPEYEGALWQGLAAPKDTPAEIMRTLNAEVNAALEDRIFRGRLTELGGTPLSGSAEEFAKVIASDIEKWGAVIKSANIKAE